MNIDETKYEQTLERLFSKLQAFHCVGAAAYKPGLQSVSRLAEAFGNPQRAYRCIHVGGTNGKGSTAHLLAAVLTAAGYKTGLYTSPHLVDFAERIRVDGHPISHAEVVDFAERFEAMDCGVDPSFFEMATVMAFEHFARHKVDVAVIEVGLGGRLDATNIITPELSAITNISLDHTGILGSTKAEIAVEKAGIFKSGVPALVSEADDELREVFAAEARKAGAALEFVEDDIPFTSYECTDDYIRYKDTPWGEVDCCLTGDCQHRNAALVMRALQVLENRGFKISAESVRKGFADVCRSTGLMARWMTVRRSPRVICDTGHNPGAWQYLGPKLEALAAESKLSMIIGFVSDKDFGTIMRMMPRNAHYYIVSPEIRRAAAAEDVFACARVCGLDAEMCTSVADGYEKAFARADEGSTIFVGGSTFVVAEMLPLVSEQR